MTVTKIALYDTRNRIYGYLDTDENTVVPLNFAISDIRDISKRKGTFSKSITLPGNKNNNVLLNNYYDVNVTAGTYDVNKLLKCAIIQDGIIILDNAILQLVSVNKMEENGSAHQMVTYTVLVKDTTSDFFTLISNKYLNDLQGLTALNHTYSAENVIDSFDNTVDDGYKYVMPYNSANLDLGGADAAFFLNEFTPGIYAQFYWDKIFNEAGYTYNWPEMNDPSIQFSKLIIPYNGDVVRTNKEDSDFYKSVATGATQTAITGDLHPTLISLFFDPINDNRMPSIGSSFDDVAIVAGTEVSDPANLYNPTNSTFTAPNFPSVTNNVIVKVTCDYEVYVQNDTAATAYLVGSTNPNYPSYTTTLIPLNGSAPSGKLYITPSIAIRKNNKVVTAMNLVQSPITITTGASFSVGKTVVSSASTSVRFTVEGISGFDTFKIAERLGISTYTNQIYRFYIMPNPIVYAPGDGPTLGLLSNSTVSIKHRITSLTVEYITELDGEYGYNIPLKMNKFVPQKIKQSDFIKSILTMFNLYVETNKEYPNILNITRRDTFYDTGVAKDWTHKLDKSKGVDIKFIPEISNKRQLITYKEDSDWANKRYKEATGQIYGQAEFVFQNEFVKDITKTEVIFSPTPTANTTFGAICPIWNGQAPKTNIRILYDGGEYNCQPYTIENFPGNVITGNTYPLISHWDIPASPNFDLNFLPPDFYFRSDNWGNNTNNNLFNLHWRRTLQQIDTGKLMTAEFNLNANDIQALKLNDRIRIDNSWWVINKIQDYDANSNELTKVELISLEDLANIPFLTRDTQRLQASSPYFDVLNKLAADKRRYINTILSDGDVTVKGRGNYVASDVANATVFGDNNIVLSDANVSGSNNEVYSPAIVQGDYNTVDPGVQGVVIFGSGITAPNANTTHFNQIVITDGGTINGQDISTIVGPSASSSLWEAGSGTGSAVMIHQANPNIAIGEFSLAIGKNSLAQGNYSFASGDSTSAQTYAETTIGSYTESIGGSASSFNSSDPVFRIGNGVLGSPSDAFRVYKNGAVYLKPITTGSVASPILGNLLFNSSSNTLSVYNGSSWTDLGSSSDPIVVTGVAIDWVEPKIYNTPTSAGTGNIISSNTGARLGIIQKIYHNSGTAPTFPANWVLLSGLYATSTLNIIYAEYSTSTRVEYWIVN